MYSLPGSRIYLREMTDLEDDTHCVVKWRNTDIARESFFLQSVVTPDSHRNFLKNKKPNDIVFMVVNNNETSSLFKSKIGMTAIIVDQEDYSGEYGRTYIDEEFRGKKFAEETEILLMSYGFDVLNLKYMWLDAFTSNQAIIKLHYKTGWLDKGLNLPEHTHPRGDVLTMECTKETWLKNRDALFRRVQVLNYIK